MVGVGDYRRDEKLGSVAKFFPIVCNLMHKHKIGRQGAGTVRNEALDRTGGLGPWPGTIGAESIGTQFDGNPATSAIICSGSAAGFFFLNKSLNAI